MQYIFSQGLFSICVLCFYFILCFCMKEPPSGVIFHDFFAQKSPLGGYFFAFFVLFIQKIPPPGLQASSLLANLYPIDRCEIFLPSLHPHKSERQSVPALPLADRLSFIYEFDYPPGGLVAFQENRYHNSSRLIG